MKFIATILTAFLLAVPMYAQRTHKVSAEYTHYADGNQSPNEAKRIALEKAKLQAIANEFGTSISQSTTQMDAVHGGEESHLFSQLSSSEVKGEWLQDTEEPVYTVKYVQDMLVVTCKVSGLARELSNKAVDFSATVLKNGTDVRYADVNFHHDDELFLHFSAPSDGYVAVYLIDESLTAYCLLPYMADVDGQYPIKHNKEYIFFSSKHPIRPNEIVDEYQMKCNEEDGERNQMYVIFSPNPFTKALDHKKSEALPRTLSYAEFTDWLTSCRKHDEYMGVKIMNIGITK